MWYFETFFLLLKLNAYNIKLFTGAILASELNAYKMDNEVFANYLLPEWEGLMKKYNKETSKNWRPPTNNHRRSIWNIFIRKKTF